MMPAKSLVRMVMANTLRSPRHFILSAFGIVIGIGAFVLFLALTQRAGSVLEKVFPVEEVQVVAPSVSFLGRDASTRLDDSTVQTIRSRPEVKSAIPRLNLAFPALGRGSFEGSDLRFEVGGFADGVDPSFVQDDERIRKYFKDWDAEPNDKNRIACVPPPKNPREDVIQSPGVRPKGGSKKPPANPWGDAAGSAAPGSAAGSAAAGSAGSAAAPGAAAGSAAGSAGSAAAPGAAAGSAAGSAAGGAAAAPPPQGDPPEPPKYYNPCPEPELYYCDDTERICKHRVPVVLSSTIVELYNNQFAKSHGMPMADKDLVTLLIRQRGLSAMRFSIGLGFTTIAGSNKATRMPPRRVEAVVVGMSSRAMKVGVTMPIQYIKRWNEEYLGPEAASSYSSIIVTLKDRNQIAPFSQWLIDKQKLRLEDSLGEKFATVIFVVRLLFLIISVAILVIAVINIGHNFFIQVSERRREIGIMRAVGATESDVQLIVLGEAAVIGVVGGVLGIGLALGIGTIWNAYAATAIPRFPFKPASWFEFKTWIWASALGFSTLFCILGGYLPARRAAKMEPAQALAQN
jgi:ABC-type lipoprotein release transport system permease subunit